MNDTGKTIGVIGLGIMGSAWYRHLLNAGFVVVGHDLESEKVADLENAGGTGAASAEEVARSAKIVVTSLDRPDALAEVVGGSRGIAAGADAGLVVVETSTFPLRVKEDARSELADAGATLLDCPISGTGHQALERDIAIYASGDEDAVERCRPLFDAVARATYYVGDFGNGSRMKFIANLLVAVHNLATAEALVLAQRSGLDLQQVLEVIGAGAGSSRMWEIRGPVMVDERYEEPAARLRMFMKDIDIISDHATEVNAPVPLFSAALSFYSAAMAQGRGDQDAAALIAVLRTLTGESPTLGGGDER